MTPPSAVGYVDGILDRGATLLPVRVRRLPRIRATWSPWSAAAVLIVLALAVPIAVVALGILGAPGETWTHLASTVLPSYLRTTGALALGVGLLTLTIGVSTAWLVSTCSFPGRRVLEWALILPLSVPAYTAAYTYAGMLDVTGPVQRVARALVPSLADRFLYIDVMGLGGVLAIFALVLYPYVYLTARTSFMRQSRTVLEASRTLGHGPARTFWRIALPLSRPALVAGVALVVMEVLNDYGAVRYYGVQTFTTGIFRAWFGLGDLDSAVRLSALLMFFVFAVLLLERALRGRGRLETTAETHRPMPRYRLSGPAAWLAFATCALPVLFGFLIPVTQLGYWAARTAGEVVDAGFVRLAANSFGLAAGAAALCVALSVILAYAARLTHGWVKALTRVSVLGYSIPGAVIAVGVLIPFGALDRGIDQTAQSYLGTSTGLILSGTLVALVFAYLVRFFAVSFMPVEAGFDRQCGNLDEASRSLGVPPLQTLGRVGLPLLRGTLLGALILVFVDVLKELPLTLILRPFDFDTLATKSFQLAMDEQLAESANAALVVIAAGMLPIALLNRLLRRSVR